MSDDERRGIPTPVCFGCGSPPALLLGGGTQAFCGSDDCRVFTWNPTKTVDELLENFGVVDLPDLGKVECVEMHWSDGTIDTATPADLAREDKP